MKYLLLLSFVASAAGFAAKVAKPVDQAVEIFAKKFPFNREPAKGGFTVGMPNRDLDGTKVKKAVYTGKRLSDLTEKEVRSNFASMAKVYGQQQALEMCQAMPVALTFNAKNFAPTLKAYAQVFGEEESKAMVGRNPGLLAVKPKDAERVDDQTMQFSYIVGATRPFSGILLPGLFALLSLPVLEGFTGENIRANILAAVTGTDPSNFPLFLN